MPPTEGFVTDQPLPSFLSADATEPQSAEMVWEASAISSRASASWPQRWPWSAS